MKPFIILQLRANDAASDNEFDAFLKYGGLAKSDAHRIRMEQAGIPTISLKEYSGVIIGGGPSNVSDDESKKSPEQKRFEKELIPLLHEIVENDIPFLGICYGSGIMANFLSGGGIISKKAYSENVDAIEQYIRPEGEKDPLLSGLPSPFKAIGGHKEACQKLPENAVWLVEGKNCPYQMFRYKNNIYGTQFHPELDGDGIAVRVDVYRNAGYFAPEEADSLKKRLSKENLSVPTTILKRFVQKYRVN